MYRLIMLLFSVSYAIASCGHEHHNHKPWHHNYHGHQHHYGRHWKHDENKFDSIVSKVIDTDRKSLQYCNENTVERYDKDMYRIIVQLDDYDVNSIVVKAKYRAIYIKAEKKGTREEYNEIRVLPRMVNIKEGGWEYLDSVLKIRFSYRNDIGGCSIVNEEQVIIPMKEENSGSDVSFGDTETEEPKTESLKQLEEIIINEKAQ